MVPWRSAMNLVTVRYNSYERKLPSSPNKLLPSLLMTVDVHSSVSAATDTVTHKVSAQIVDVRPEGIASVGSVANWVTSYRIAGSKETIGGICQGQQSPLEPEVDPNCIIVAVIRTEVATVKWVFGEMETAMMLDSGSSISPIQKDVVSHVHGARTTMVDVPCT